MQPMVSGITLRNLSHKRDFGIWRAIRLGQNNQEILIAHVSVAKLGLGHGAIRHTIYERAVELGLFLFPCEISSQLCSQLGDYNLKGQAVLIGMEPINTPPDGEFIIHRIEWNYKGETRFHESNGSPTCFWSPSTRWLFEIKKQDKVLT